MSMSTSVYGFKPPDEKWRKMKAVYDAAKAAGIDIPREVDEFFNFETPDDAGVRVDLKPGYVTGCCTEYHEEMSKGFEIDLAKVPEGVKVIRFVNSW